MLFWYSKLPILLISSTAWAVFQTAAHSQIIRDQTLGIEHSIVTPQEFRDLIEGGAIRGSNLFHSFLEFNVNEGQNVYFANPDGIANILTRVTGGSRSQIFGTLGVDGPANLYLINPN
ncbi:MAG: filamentous hemagglutinin N-terminal domain-containing protein, partial [Moorea sp. SIO3I7]|nr:filamentous hemagglutinin N-terminal domain-containing protein [Moorena sp. SIO3I7]